MSDQPVILIHLAEERSMVPGTDPPIYKLTACGLPYDPPTADYPSLPRVLCRACQLAAIR